MSEDSHSSAKSGGSSGGSKAPLLFALLNTIGVLAAVGALVYTRMLFKRPAITEGQERTTRLAEAEKQENIPTKTAAINLDPVTVNIKGGAGDATPKMHYVTVGLSIEIRDENRSDQVLEIKPLLVDRILHLLGNKAFSELNTVQGRYVLRTEIQDIANALITEREPKTTAGRRPVLVTGIYLTQFTLQ